MLEDRPGVREVERCVRKRVSHDVVPSDLDIGESDRLEKPGVDVCGQYVAAWADAIRNPAGNGAAAAADLEAAPATIRHTAGEKMADCASVVHFCEGGEAVTRLGRRIVEHVHHRPPFGFAGLSPMMRAISWT